jgi:hypothetical protein
MPTNEETGTAPDPVEGNPTEIADPTPEPVQAAPDPAPQAPTVKGVEAYRLAFGDAIEDPELDALTESVTVEALQSLPKEARAIARALLRHVENEGKTREATHAEREKAIADKEAAFRLREREFKQREAATLAMAAAAKPPGEKPDVDPFTPDGAAKLAEHMAAKAAWEREAPLREKAAAAARQARWDELCETYPDLKKKNISDEFAAYMRKENEGWTRESGKPPPLTTDRGVRLFFAERAAASRASEEATRRAAQDATRRDAARHIGRSGGGGMPDPLARYNQLRKSDPDAAFDLLNTDPAVKKAFLAAHSH